MELLTPHYGTVIWLLIVFGILILVLRRFAWSPILQAIKQREQKIEDALFAAERTKEEMAQLQFDNKQLMRQAKEERDEILKEARVIRESIIDEAKEKANVEADRIVQGARESIHFEKLAAITELKNQIAQMSIEIARKVLERELDDPQKQKEFIDKELVDIEI